MHLVFTEMMQFSLKLFFLICVLLVDVHSAQALLKYVFLVTLITPKTLHFSGRLSWGELCLLMNVESYLNFKMI